MMNLNDHYFKSVLFYKPQGTLGSKYKVNKYHKITKISPGAYIFQRPFLRGLFLEGLSTKGNLRFKINWASLIPGNKFTVFALFYFEFEGYFPSTRRGDLTEGFCITGLGGLYLEGLIHGGAYFQNFTVIN